MSSTNISGKRRGTQIKNFLYCDLRIKQFTLMFVPIIFRKGHCGTMCLLWPKILFIKKIRSKESASQENTSIFIENFPSKVYKWVYKNIYHSVSIPGRSQWGRSWRLAWRHGLLPPPDGVQEHLSSTRWCSACDTLWETGRWRVRLLNWALYFV